MDVRASHVLRLWEENACVGCWKRGERASGVKVVIFSRQLLICPAGSSRYRRGLSCWAHRSWRSNCQSLWSKPNRRSVTFLAVFFFPRMRVVLLRCTHKLYSEGGTHSLSDRKDSSATGGILKLQCLCFYDSSDVPCWKKKKKQQQHATGKTPNFQSQVSKHLLIYILVKKVPPTHNRLLPKAPNVHPSTCEYDCQIQC